MNTVFLNAGDSRHMQGHNEHMGVNREIGLNALPKPAHTSSHKYLSGLKICS